MHSLAFFTSLCLYFESLLFQLSCTGTPGHNLLLYLMVMAEKKKGRPSRFRSAKSASEEQVLADEAVPSSTKYKMGFKNISRMAAGKGDESTDFRSRWSFQRL